MKKLFLLLAISTLGMSAAMAQTETGNGYAQNYWRQVDARQQMNEQVQSGSSDVHAKHALPFNGDYTTLANPG
jgi:hypothetical protein